MKSIGKINAAIYRNLQCIMNYRLSSLGIPASRYDFLYVITQYEGLSQKELSEMLFVDKSTTAKAVKSLVEKGYVIKKTSEKDRRADELYMSDKCRAIKPMLEETFRDMIALAGSALSPEENDEAVSLMEKILATLVDEKKRNKERL